jgi:hypothetical protein
MATATTPRKTAKHTGTVPAEEPVNTVATAISIKPLNQRFLEFYLRGTTPYLQLRFSEKTLQKMMDTQAQGTQARSKKVREPRNFTEDYENAKHKMADGSCGIPCGAFRNGMISACRTVGYHMTKAKLAVFVVADGLDVADGTPLVRIYGEPVENHMHVRNASGVTDIRSRPLWTEWHVKLRVRYDADLFSESDITNLITRMGAQVAVGEGRADSKQSNGIDMGFFELITREEFADATSGGA